MNDVTSLKQGGIWILTPDKKELKLCTGGVQVLRYDQFQAYRIYVQTPLEGWQSAATYQSEEETGSTMLKIKETINSGAKTVEL